MNDDTSLEVVTDGISALGRTIAKLTLRTSLGFIFVGVGYTIASLLTSLPAILWPVWLPGVFSFGFGGIGVYLGKLIERRSTKKLLGR